MTAGLDLRRTNLDVPVKADRRHEDPVQVFEGHRPMLLLIDEECEVAFVEVQQDAHGRPFADTSFRPIKHDTLTFERAKFTRHNSGSR